MGSDSLFNASIGQLKIIRGEADSYICPFCLHEFSREDIGNLTVEDAPQTALGGGRIALTCSTCNNTYGKTIDCHLVNQIDLQERKALPSNTESRIQIYIPQSDKSVAGRILDVKVQGNYKVAKVAIDVKRNNPKNVDEAVQKLIPETASSYSFDYNQEKMLPQNAYCGLFKDAYILLFSVIGYYGVFGDAYELMRNQLDHPEENLIPHSIVSTAKSPIQDGVYAIDETSFKGYLIKVTLKKRENHTYNIIFPTSSYTFEEADAFAKSIQKGERIRLIRLSGRDFFSESEAQSILSAWINDRSSLLELPTKAG